MFVPFSYSSFHPLINKFDTAGFSDLLTSYSIHFVLPTIFPISFASNICLEILTNFSASILVTYSSHSLILLSTHSLIGLIPQDSWKFTLFCQLFFLSRLLPTFVWFLMFLSLFLVPMP
jgi:hypothetical protein